jgi:hypothetical protein
MFLTEVTSLERRKSVLLTARNTAMVLFTVLLFPAFAPAQEQVADSGPLTWMDSLQTRWVGTHLGRPLHIDFYADTMVVVNDRHVSDYEATRDSIIVFGDTTFAVHYRFAMDRMIVRTDSGNVITMSAQGTLARPLRGNWFGSPLRRRELQIELQMNASGAAYWRTLPRGAWIGESGIDSAERSHLRGCRIRWPGDPIQLYGLACTTRQEASYCLTRPYLKAA